MIWIGFDEERAILLLRMKKFKDAFTIFVYLMQAIELAKEYCLDEIFEGKRDRTLISYKTSLSIETEPLRQKANQLFLFLLEVLLNPPQGNNLHLKEAVDVLNCHGAFIHAADVSL